MSQVVAPTDAPTLQGIIIRNIALGSMMCSDTHASYVGLNGIFVHKTVKHSAKHTQLYVHECAFRLNEGNSKYNTVDRLKASAQGMRGKRLTYKMLTRNKYRSAHSPTP